MSDFSAHHPAATAAYGQVPSGLRQNGGATAPVTPLVNRLCDIRTRVSNISGVLHQFQAHLNGDPPQPGNTEKVAGYPPCSMEDILSQIEQHLRDIEDAHQRIASRF